MIPFPLYAIRKYVEISVEGEYKIICTRLTKYVLDFSESSIASYSHRRLELLRRTLPYKIYPIRHILTTHRELVGLSGKLFYTDSGKLLKYKASVFYALVPALIESSWLDSSGYSNIKVRGYSTIFKSNAYNKEKYAIIAYRGRSEFLLKFSNTNTLDQKRIMI